MAVCILKYLHTEMHSSPLPRRVDVVVILSSTHFLRVNLNRKTSHSLKLRVKKIPRV